MIDERIQLIFTILASIFDLCIKMIYFNVIFHERKSWVSKPTYYFYFIGVSTAFWFARVPSANWVTFIFLSIAEIFILSLLFESRLIIKLFATASLLVFSMLSEVFASGLLTIVESYNGNTFHDGNFNLYAVMLSKLIKFIIILVVLLLMKRNTIRANFKDYICLIIVPFLSIFIIIALTVESVSNDNNNFTANTSIIGILIINFIVYYLLNNIIKANEIREKQIQLETQFQFQEKKYEQTSMSFKKISSIIHDTNKHLVYLRECAIQDDSAEAISYINTAIDSIDSSYKRINTGHLVIDALISNALNNAQSHNIKFKTDINIDKTTINIERYDLSIILGNLLDNAVEACIKIANLDDRYINVNVFTNEDSLIINIINSTDGHTLVKKTKTDKADKILHGYGLENVSGIVNKYGGSFTVERKDSRFEVIAVLPFLENTTV